MGFKLRGSMTVIFSANLYFHIFQYKYQPIPPLANLNTQPTNPLVLNWYQYICQCRYRYLKHCIGSISIGLSILQACIGIGVGNNLQHYNPPPWLHNTHSLSIYFPVSYDRCDTVSNIFTHIWEIYYWIFERYIRNSLTQSIFELEKCSFFLMGQNFARNWLVPLSGC